jgi:putative PIN family toxin of toxin-antitoxin system
MTDPRPRAVLDTVVLIQFLLSGRGAARACIEELRAGRYDLLTSDNTMAELHDVAFRPKFIARPNSLSPDRVLTFIAEVESRATHIPQPPPAFRLPRDPKDEPFTDLAIAGNANFIVTWNQRHLTYLMNRDTPEGIDFCTRFPTIRILTPPEYLTAIRALPKT